MDALRGRSTRPGAVLAGKYRLLAPIAEGGMGAVWRAEDLRLGSPVAIKLIHHRDVNNAEILARFEAEAEIAAQLRSPHVVQVFDAGVDRESAMPFIAMELLEGESLRDRLASSGVLAPAMVVEILSQVARALTRAHELGIVHRDLKPANVFLLHDGDRDVVKVLDFGIAKRTQGIRTGPTVTGDLLGTPTYMSPEQILSSKEVDYRTDLWSLAVIATECLTGRLPFDCDNLPALALAICHGQCTPPSQLGPVPAGFDAWFHKATQLRPAERFSSAVAMTEELRRVCQGEAPAVRAVAREEDVETRSDGVEPRPSPSVGPTTTTVPRQVGPLRRRQQRRMAVLASIGALLIVATCTALRERTAGRSAASAGALIEARAPATPGATAPVVILQPQRQPEPTAAPAEAEKRTQEAPADESGGSAGAAGSPALAGRAEGAGISIVREAAEAAPADRAMPARPAARPAPGLKALPPRARAPQEPRGGELPNPGF